MLRLSAALSLGAVLFAAAVAAQGNLVTERQDLMKASGAAFRAVTPMLRGEQPYDKAVADRSVAAWAAKAQRLPQLFPQGSASPESRALPTIWSDSAGWMAEIENFRRDVAAAQAATGSLDTFRPAAQAVGQECQSCHQKFQRPQT